MGTTSGGDEGGKTESLRVACGCVEKTYLDHC